MKYVAIALLACLSFTDMACSTTGTGQTEESAFVSSGVVVYIDTAG